MTVNRYSTIMPRHKLLRAMQDLGFPREYSNPISDTPPFLLSEVVGSSSWAPGPAEELPAAGGLVFRVLGLGFRCT